MTRAISSRQRNHKKALACRFQTLVWYAAKGGTMTDERTIEARIYERLSKVIDPELADP